MPAVLKITPGGARPVLIHTGRVPGKFGHAHGECSDSKSADGRFRRSEWTEAERQQQAERQADRLDGGVVRHAGGSRAKATARAGQKESRERWRAPISATASRPRDRETDAGADKAMRVQTSGFGTQEVAQNTAHAVRMDNGPATTRCRDRLQAESGLYGGSAKPETGRRSFAGSGVLGERTATCESRGARAWAWTR